MVTTALKIFEWLRRHKLALWGSLMLSTVVIAVLVSRLTYKEDISDFLPLDANRVNALEVYQDISGANRLFLIFQSKNESPLPDSLVAAVDQFAQLADGNDCIRNLVTEIDVEQIEETMDFVYSNIPYFLYPDEIDSISSLLTTKSEYSDRLAKAKELLMFPSGGIVADNISRDPLGLFSYVVANLQSGNSSALKYEMYEGHILSSDFTRAIAMLESPYGSSETDNNQKLLDFLNECKRQIEADNPMIEVHITGGPAIAVGNASRIKTDSLIAVCLSVILILVILLYIFKSVTKILLIFLSVGWGAAFGLAALSLVSESVSIIVIGISAVIVGIAVNYPLHYIAHAEHVSSTKQVIKEIAAPLLVGNITTVGAFLALVPLNSVALRDLGLFSSLLLVGTILFVLVYLPHIIRPRLGKTRQMPWIIRQLSDFDIEERRWILAAVCILTVVFGYYSLQTRFDPNMGNINYMTAEQKADMTYFQQHMTVAASDIPIYIVSTASSLDSALAKSAQIQPAIAELLTHDGVKQLSSCCRFVPSTSQQQNRLSAWQEHIGTDRNLIEDYFVEASEASGFNPEAFDDFQALISTDDYPIQPIEYFNPLITTLFQSNISVNNDKELYSVVDVLTVSPECREQILSWVESNIPDAYVFDVQSMNSSIATNLSNDFNYIGWVCGAIVFVFLWISLGSIELAMISFLPMAISWIWILGIMAMLGISFNIVNIILATFIFGQGDDYTIFMTEGASYEYAYRRKMLGSYKSAIIISAIIMFLAIGTLIIAQHPALRSLAEVTIVGMFSVVLMAYLFPPMLFKWLVMSSGQYRLRPLSLKPLLSMGVCCMVFFPQLAFVHTVGLFMFVFSRSTMKKRWMFRKLVHHLFLFDIKHIPGLKFNVINESSNDFNTPSLIVVNHQSMLDSVCLMALSHKITIIANTHASSNPLTATLFKWMGFYTLTGKEALDMTRLKENVAEGYSIAIFPEGQRNPDSSILRFHKGAFYIAKELGLYIRPVLLHDVNYVLPRNSICVYPGTVTVSVRDAISIDNLSYQEATKSVHRYFVKEYETLRRQTETVDYFKPFVIDRYRYKGVEVVTAVRGALKNFPGSTIFLDGEDDGREIQVVDSSYGATAMMTALLYPNHNVVAMVGNKDEAIVATYSLSCLPNVTICQSVATSKDAISIIPASDD